MSSLKDLQLFLDLSKEFFKSCFRWSSTLLGLMLRLKLTLRLQSFVYLVGRTGVLYICSLTLSKLVNTSPSLIYANVWKSLHPERGNCTDNCHVWVQSIRPMPLIIRVIHGPVKISPRWTIYPYCARTSVTRCPMWRGQRLKCYKALISPHVKPPQLSPADPRFLYSIVHVYSDEWGSTTGSLPCPRVSCNGSPMCLTCHGIWEVLR